MTKFINLHTHKFSNLSDVIEVVNQYPWEFDASIPNYSIGIHPWFIDGNRLESDLETIKKIIDLGFFVGFDTIGKNDYFPDVKRIEFLLELEKTNRIHRVVLSEDLTRKSHLNYKGGIGYNYIFTEFIPKLLDAGMKQSSIDQMLITNPEIVFSESK